MNCPEHTQYDLLVMDLLEQPEAESLLAHARGCPRCRSRFDQSRRAHAQRIRMYEAFDRDHEQLRDQLMAALPAGAPQAPRGGRLGGMIMSMNTRTMRRTAAILAPAACVLLALVLYLAPGQNVAFADVLERLRQARTLVCQFASYQGDDQPVSTGTMYLSDKFGSRIEINTPGQGQIVLLRPVDGPIRVVNPGRKSVVRVDASASGRVARNAPDEFIDYLRQLTGDADRGLGRKEIDGHEAEGFEIDGDRLGLLAQPGTDAWARVWVDVNTALPVLIEIETTMPDGQFIRTLQNQFVWDTPLEAKLFELDVPDGTPQIAVAVPPAAEQTLIAGLRRYAEMSGGEYPPAMDMTTISSSIARLVAVREAQGDKNENVITRDLAADMLTLRQMCQFYRQLLRDGHEPEYSGDSVTSADAKAVLLRWWVDDSTQRVIYGDLHAETLAIGGR